jgi:dephospho-CoA kinase
VEAAFPGSTRDGIVDRVALGKQLSSEPTGFKRLEAIVHPLVRARELAFLEQQKAGGADLVVLDIPLLFESGGAERVDKIVVVSSDPQIQRLRVLARPDMTEEKFNLILSRQMPDAEKRARADYVVNTGDGIKAARKQVDEIIADLRRTVKREH